jgi:predicted DNA-binding transcriptional regulator AlpA
MSTKPKAAEARVILSSTETAARFKCHVITLGRRMNADKKFPRPIRLSNGRLAWFEDEVNFYINNRPRA